jgi:hypothetical protein
MQVCHLGVCLTGRKGLALALQHALQALQIHN